MYSRRRNWNSFEILRETGLKPGQSLLNMGCGYGDLAIWLEERGCLLPTTPVSTSAPSCSKRDVAVIPAFGCWRGRCSDLDSAPISFDWVMRTGALNDDLGDGGEHAWRVIRSHGSKAGRLGIDFNLLDARHPGTAGRWDFGRASSRRRWRAFVARFAFRVLATG